MHLFSFYPLVFRFFPCSKNSYSILFKLTKKIMIGPPKKEVKLKCSAKEKNVTKFDKY